MNSTGKHALLRVGKSFLTAAEFEHLANVPPATEWFKNLDNDHTARAYKKSIRDFMRFAGIDRPVLM